MKPIMVLSIAAIAVAMTAAAPTVGRFYVTNIPVSGLANSPFDSWLAKNLFTLEEMDALASAKGSAEGQLAIERGANIQQITGTYRDQAKINKDGTRQREWHLSRMESYAICAENDVTICLDVSPDGEIVYLNGTKEATDQRCDVTVTHNGDRAFVGKHAAFSVAGAITFYGPRTVGSRQAMDIIHNANQFLVNYVCEYGSYGTYSFKSQKPLKYNKEIPQ